MPASSGPARSSHGPPGARRAVSSGALAGGHEEREVARAATVAAALKAFRGEAEQLRGRRQVPIRGGGVDVSEVGGQQWKLGGDIVAVAIPAQERVDREGVTQVMCSWPPAGR